MFWCLQTGVSSQMEQLLLSEERTIQFHELRKLMQKHELESCGRFLNVDDQAVTNSRQENFQIFQKSSREQSMLFKFNPSCPWKCTDAIVVQ